MKKKIHLTKLYMRADLSIGKPVLFCFWCFVFFIQTQLLFFVMLKYFSQSSRAGDHKFILHTQTKSVKGFLFPLNTLKQHFISQVQVSMIHNSNNLKHHHTNQSPYSFQFYPPVIWHLSLSPSLPLTSPPRSPPSLPSVTFNIYCGWRDFLF